MKSYCYLLLCLFILFLTACSEKENENEKMGWAGFNENGCVTIDFSCIDGNVERKLLVLNRKGSSTVQIQPYTQKELDAYNNTNKTNYSLMPEGTYAIDKTVTFSNGEQSKEAILTIFPDNFFQVVRKDTEKKQYTLPLKVDEEPEGVIYVMNMTSPLIRLTEKAHIRLMKKSDKLTLKAYMHKNKNSTEAIANAGDVNLDVVVADQAEKWVNEYNAKHGTDCRLLPEGSYALGKLTGKKGEECSVASITFNRTLLEYENFILPLQLVGENELAALDHSVTYVKVVNQNTYDDVGREYDDGKNIIYHVKLAIDAEGFAMMNNDMDFFRENFAIQWDEINHRFNALDKKGKLKRNYIFVPDLEDIIVYKYESNDSRWDVATNYADRIDRDKYQLVVSYDFWQHEGEAGGGYGGRCPEGINNIMVTCYSKNQAEILKTIELGSLNDESIVHELGHFRGIIDTYACEVSASNNLISNEKFSPESGNMMVDTYLPTKDVEWSEYEMYVINSSGVKNCNIGDIIVRYFADDMKITVTENGQSSKGFTLSFYPLANGKIEKRDKTYTEYGSSITLDAKYIFGKVDGWWNNYPYGQHYHLLLMEVISIKTGKKAYQFMPIYDVHKQGLKDKSETKIEGKSIFKTTIDIS